MPKTSLDLSSYLADLERKLEGDALKPLLADLSESLGEEALNLISEGFRTETDPYGKKWAKRKRETKKTRGRMVLSGETSRLKGGWHIRQQNEGGFTIAPAVGYAAPHQTGAPSRGLVKRRMIPDRDLPAKWRRQLEEAAAEGLADIFRDMVER